MPTTPDSVDAYVLEELGFDGLVRRQRAWREPGPGQVLVEMKAASLNFRDLKILKGIYLGQPDLPLVPLSDGAAQVVRVGDGVSSFAPGDRVLPVYWEGWHSGPYETLPAEARQKGGETDGTAIRYAVYDEADVLPIPDWMSYEQAACLPCAGVTAWQSLVYVGRIKAGDIVLVMGSGGVSVFALQIALMSGARVIATTSSDAKAERLLAMGASDVVNYATNPEWGDAVRALTGGVGVDHVVEVAGEETIVQSLHATRDGGQIGAVGNLTGQFASSTFEVRGIAIREIAVGSREMTADLLRALDLHRVEPVIDRAFPFEQLPDALRYLDAGSHFGKVVVTF